MKHREAKRRWAGLIARLVLPAIAVAWGTAAPIPGAEKQAVATPAGAGAAELAVPVQGADVPLLSGEALSDENWSFISRDKESRLAGTWQVQQADGEAVLICRGEPYGYLKTTRAFANFLLRLEWKFPADENGNSGVLLHTNGQGKDKVWPTAIQVQLHQPVCGSIFPSGDATSDNEIRDVRDVCKSVNQWNSCEITSVAGRISVEMNGKKIGTVTGCHPHRGGIALQSEGAEVHFRRINLTVFADADTPLQPVCQIPAAGICPWQRPELLELSQAPPGSKSLGMVAAVRRNSYLDGMVTYDVVHRDALAADGHPLRARHRERVLVAPAAAAAISDRHGDLRSRYARHIRR
ncbi:MAG: DUF1080 domain-containing protein [Planctomycetaceae bacterium]